MKIERDEVITMAMEVEHAVRQNAGIISSVFLVMITGIMIGAYLS